MEVLTAQQMNIEWKSLTAQQLDTGWGSHLLRTTIDFLDYHWKVSKWSLEDVEHVRSTRREMTTVMSSLVTWAPDGGTVQYLLKLGFFTSLILFQMHVAS